MSDDAGAHADPAWRDRELERLYLDDLHAELRRARHQHEQQLIGLDNTRNRICQLEHDITVLQQDDPSPIQEAAREGTGNSDSDHRDSRAGGHGQ